MIRGAARRENPREAPVILGLAGTSALLYTALALGGDLRARPALLLGAHAALLALMGLAWIRLRRRPAIAPIVLLAALAFRLIVALGPPTLSDDVYRYVWDGRVQLHGVHPYAHAPDDPVLAGLRDENWTRINHPSVKTIYPPLAQLFFLGLAATGAGPLGFKLTLGLLDFGVVLALGQLLRRLELPLDRLVFYAWNPLAVLETAGSGHVEPLAILLLLLAVGWIIGGRVRLSMAALAGAIQVKLLPVLLVPAFGRRASKSAWWVLVAVLLGLLAPYALLGPPIGAGLFDYAQRWEYNAFAYAGVQGTLEWLDVGPHFQGWIGALQQRWGGDAPFWQLLYRLAWPRPMARVIVLAALLGWIALLALRPRDLDVARETFLVLAAAVVLAPTVHPWYLLWTLPFAAAFLSWGWLALAATVPLAYLSAGADLPWSLRCLIWLPPLALMLAEAIRPRR